MSRCEGLAGQVYYPVTELIGTLCDEAALFTVKGLTDGNFCVAAITVRWEVRGSSPYRRKRASLHSSAPSSVPLTVDDSTVSQSPVFDARCM